MKSKISLALGLLLLLFILPGCYTMLSHPESMALVDENQNRKSCMDCHEESWLYHYDPYWYGSSYQGDWRYYYGRPWWYDDYWYYYPPGETAPVESGGRHMWNTPGLRAPETLGVNPTPKGQGTNTQQGSTGTKTPPENSSEKKTEEKKTERHMWTK